MGAEPRQNVRAVLMTPQRSILLMKFASRSRQGCLWVTPGGGVERGEDPHDALRREIREETGLEVDEIGPELWTREATFRLEGRRISERERFYLVWTHHFGPVPVALAEQERESFQEFRWWTIEDILRSSERFAPRRLGALLRQLEQEGPPPAPLDAGF